MSKCYFVWQFEYEYEYAYWQKHIIHRNTTNVLDMTCCHNHQRNKSINIKILKYVCSYTIYIGWCTFPLTKVIPIMFERVTTQYQTLQTWIDRNAKCYRTPYHTFSLSLTWARLNATRYHNFNVLPLALPQIFIQFSMICGYLKHVATLYHQIYKTMFINIKKKLKVTLGNLLPIAQWSDPHFTGLKKCF